MVKSASSCGVNAARFVSLLRRLTQYLQSNTQQLVIRTFNSVTHRPSAEKEWQHPDTEEEVLPIYPFLAVRFPPLDVQAASYLAASVKTVSFSRTSMRRDRSPGRGSAGMFLGRLFNVIDNAEQLCRQESDAYQHKEEAPTSHRSYPPYSNFCSIHRITRTIVRVK